MKKQKEQGITLVALIVTIIILLILAGITIGQLTGNGIFENAKQASDKSRMSNAQEKVELAVLASYGNDGHMDEELLKENLNMIDGLDERILEIVYPLTAKVDGYEFIIDQNWKIKNNEVIDVASGDKNVDGTRDSEIDELKAEIAELRSSLANYATKSDLNSYATKTELKNKNTTWTELASTKLKTEQTEVISNWDDYDFIAVEFYWEGYGSCGISVVPTTSFKNTTSANRINVGYSNHVYNGTTNLIRHAWVNAYYSSGSLKYAVENDEADPGKIYCKVYGIN